jgi:hypothetical protein
MHESSERAGSKVPKYKVEDALIFFKLMASLPDEGRIDGSIITLKAYKVHCQPVPIIILIFNAY